MLGIRTVSCLSHYPTAASIDKLLSVSCSRPRPRGTNPFFLASVLAGNDVWWRWWSLKLGGRVSEGQILSVAFPLVSLLRSILLLLLDCSIIHNIHLSASFSFLFMLSHSFSSLFSLDPGSRPKHPSLTLASLSPVLAGVHLTRRVAPLSENNAGPLTAAGWIRAVTVEWRPGGGEDGTQPRLSLRCCSRHAGPGAFTGVIHMVSTKTLNLTPEKLSSLLEYLLN